jgi:hypothetical protein
MHRANWSTIIPGGVGKCHYPVSKARNTTWDHIIKVIKVIIIIIINNNKNKKEVLLSY